MLRKWSSMLKFYRFSESTKKDSLSTHVQQQLNTMLSEQQIQQQTQRRKEQLQLKHTQLQKLVDKQIKLPLKLYGTKDTFQSKYAYLPERIMAYYRIHPTMITNFLLKIYKASLYAMLDENAEFMEEYWEQGLRRQVLDNIREAKKNYTLSILEDKDYLKNMAESCEILDAYCVRGLSMDRNANLSPQQYQKREQADDVGLVTYTPNFLTQDNDRFIDPNQNKKIYEGYQNMVLRVLLRIRTPLRFHVKQIPISDEVYTWEHLVLVQNQMVSPKHLQSKYKLETLMEWLGKYRFGMWKVVDIDNFMKGNSLFKKYQAEDEYLDPIFEGTVFDKSTHANIRKF